MSSLGDGARSMRRLKVAFEVMFAALRGYWRGV